MTAAAAETHTHAGTTFERFTLTADDGFALAAMRWVPPNPRAILQIAHGMSEYAFRYAPFAQACAAAGLAVYAHDHRGHGASIDASTPLGFYAESDGWGKVVGDLHTMHHHARGQHPKLPLFLFAHSMGTLIGRAYLLAHGGELSGAILSATGWRAGAINHALRLVALREAHKNGARAPSPRMSKLVFGSFNLRFRPARTAFDWLSRDTAAVDAYVADPLCGFPCSGTLWADLLGGVAAVERAENDPSQLTRSLPLLLIAGSHDPVSMGGLGHGQLAKRYRAAGNEHVEDKRYPEARHELINETNRDEVWRDIVGWVGKHT
ncbi:MAG: alpha/beta fold hydrolase [Polyangiaceae bacterium]|jgi:alpha-beta hydrolase superfamily lysophospholipase